MDDLAVGSGEDAVVGGKVEAGQRRATAEQSEPEAKPKIGHRGGQTAQGKFIATAEQSETDSSRS
jgi:hypothetical protein